MGDWSSDVCSSDLEDHAEAGGEFGEALGEDKAVAGLVAGQQQAAGHLVGDMLQRRLLDDAAGAVEQAVLDAEVLQDLDVLGGIVEALLVAEHLQRAAAALLVGDAGVAPQLFQAGAAVGDRKSTRLNSSH